MKTRGFAKFAFVNHLDTKFDHQWKITLVVDKKEKAKLEAAGLKVNKVVDDETDKISYEYTFSRKLKRKKSNVENPKPDCIDAVKNPYTGAIGDGSEVIVRHKPFSWTYKGREGMSSDLCAVQVIKLVPYEGKVKEEEDPEDDFDVVEDGFVAPEEDRVPKDKEKTSDEDEDDDDFDNEEEDDEPEY